MIDFFSNYGSALLRILNLIFWAFWYTKLKNKNANKLTVEFFLGFNLINIVWNTAMILTLHHPKVYIIFWIIIVIFEVLMILSVLFSLKNLHNKFHDYYIMIISILSIPVILAGIIATLRWDYKPINLVDFNFQIILMIGSIWVLKNILSQENFLENIEAFFIFSGMVMLFAIHIIASNSQLFGFLKNWKFGHIATIVSQIFWLGGVFTSWKIRSKYLS